METRDLEYVLAVAAHGGIGRAAERIGISQPALSKAIQRVEALIGLPLFERTALGMTPTHAGASFIDRARRIQLEYDDALKEMRGIRTGEQGVLRIGYSPSMPSAVVLRACRQLLRERPVARLKFSMRLARELMDLLLAGELDLAISPVPQQRANEFSVRDLFNDRLTIVADEAHPLHQREKLTLADLVDQEWLLPGPQFVLRQQIEAAFRERGLPAPHPRVETDFAGAALFNLIRDTHILSFAGAESIGSVIGFRPINLGQEELDLRRRVGIISRAGAYLSPLAERMIVILKEHIAPSS